MNHQLIEEESTGEWVFCHESPVHGRKIDWRNDFPPEITI
jgi:hypothetical protein